MKVWQPPGEIGNGTIQQQAHGSEPRDPRDEKTGTGTPTHNPKVTRPGCGSQDPRTAATIQVRRQLPGVYDTAGTVQTRN